MKVIATIISILFSVLSIAQTSQKVNMGVPVKVTDWRDRGLLIAKNFFNETKDSIISQIQVDEFEKVKKLSSAFSWPKEIQGEIRFRKDSIAKREFYQKLDKLKMYKIASYQHYFQGSKMSRFCILKVPYEANKDWDQAAKWDVVYFIVEERSVKKL